MRQYLQLVSNTTSATPIDIWTPSGKYVKPATVDQVAIGYFRKNMIEILLEAPFHNRAYTKPLGYAGDYQMIKNPDRRWWQWWKPKIIKSDKLTVYTLTGIRTDGGASGRLTLLRYSRQWL